MENTDAIEKELKDARAAQERRRKAPKLSISEQMKDVPRKRMITQFAPECTGKSPEWHPCWAPIAELREWINRGYEPVVSNGMKVEDQGDVLLKVPQDIYQEDLMIPVRVSQRRLGEKDSDTNTNPAKGGEEVLVESPESGQSAAGVRRRKG